MSTNKTSNLNLHAWTYDDPVKMSEFNENFAAIDAALGALQATIPQIITGRYTGDGSTYRTINIGATPKAVIIMVEGYRIDADNNRYGGIGGTNFYFTNITMVESGFQVASTGAYQSNMQGKMYGYIAFC